VRVGFPGGPRLEWYDRNPYHRFQSYMNNNTAPHGVTTRWTYTVPTGKKAFVEGAQTYIHRITAAAPVGLVQVVIYVTPSGGGMSAFLLSQLITNNVGDKDHTEIGGGPVLYPGDAIEGQTSDVSTGGTTNLNITTEITEFNA